LLDSIVEEIPNLLEEPTLATDEPVPSTVSHVGYADLVKLLERLRELTLKDVWVSFRVRYYRESSSDGGEFYVWRGQVVQTMSVLSWFKDVHRLKCPRSVKLSIPHHYDTGMPPHWSPNELIVHSGTVAYAVSLEGLRWVVKWEPSFQEWRLCGKAWGMMGVTDMIEFHACSLDMGSA
jgi:hypothetical protein